MNNFDSLSLSLSILVAVRILGILIFIDLFIQKRDTKYLILILGWMTGAIGTSLGLYTHTIFGEMEHTINSMLGALGTFLVFCGALLYFDTIKPKFAYIGSVVIILYGLLPLVNINTGPSPGLIIQILSAFFLTFVVLFRRKLFLKLARSSYFWLASLAILTDGLTIAFALGVITPDRLALGFAGTTLINVIGIIFFLHLEYSISVHQIQQANQERLEEWERFITIFDNFPELLYICDPETYEVLFANKKFEETLGFNPIGKLCYKAFQNFDSPCPFCTNEILSNNSEPYIWEHHNKVVDRHYLISDQMIRWSDGRKARFEMAVDITDRKNAEDRLNEHVKELESLNSLLVGRENRMIKLKREVNALSEELGREGPYDLTFTND
jgi:PAS domain-containing protein